jgi:hypothetical protein
MMWFPSPDVALTWTGTTPSSACLRRFAERKPPCGWSPAVLPRLACHRRSPDQGILLGGVVFSLAQRMIPFGGVCISGLPIVPFHVADFDLAQPIISQFC